MNQESTLGIIKPDAVDRNLIGSIIKMIEENNITMEYYELMVDLYTKNKNPEKVKEISYMIELIKSQ